MVADAVKGVLQQADDHPRTGYVLGAIAVTFLIWITLRGDLQAYEDILLGTPATPQTPPQPTEPTSP